MEGMQPVPQFATALDELERSVTSCQMWQITAASMAAVSICVTMFHLHIISSDAGRSEIQSGRIFYRAYETAVLFFIQKKKMCLDTVTRVLLSQ